MKSQSSPIYNFEEMREVKNDYQLKVMYRELIIVALVVVAVIGWIN